jgi:hypothetical protein
VLLTSDTAVWNAAMRPRVRLIGADGDDITDLASWCEHSPPEGGERQWVDGYSAKEQEKAWLRRGTTGLPVELAYVLGLAGFDDVTQWTGYPERETKLDGYGRGRQGWRHHDMLLIGGPGDSPRIVVGIEAKACEGYDGLVRDRATVPAPSRRPERANLMANALFGRPVCDEDSRTLIDHELGEHGYQLWTGAIGTLREAQELDLPEAIFLVHQFVPAGGPGPGDNRNWEQKLADNVRMLREFTSALGPSPVTHGTVFIRPGVRLRVIAICSPIAATTA